MSQPAPTASGTLAATPLGHLLIYALDRHLTGTIVFEVSLPVRPVEAVPRMIVGAVRLPNAVVALATETVSAYGL